MVYKRDCKVEETCQWSREWLRCSDKVAKKGEKERVC